MLTRPHKIQFLWLAAAVALLSTAFWMTGWLDSDSQKYQLVPDNIVVQNDPYYALLRMTPGGLRAPLINYFWMRSERLKMDGQYQESMQLAEIICRLQPRFPDVWQFNAWNMVYNISIGTHTAEERWMWVNHGIELLRDKGIPLNPRSPTLYKELAWIFQNKLNGTLDDMHLVYKARWAAQMQRLLGAPPMGETSEVIAAFEPIAKAPLDKDPLRKGKQPFQYDCLALLTDPQAAGQPPASHYDPQVAAYVNLLAKHHVVVFPNGEQSRTELGLLPAYALYSLDEAVDSARAEPLEPKTARDKELTALINDPAYASARGKLLALVRAQILWNQYKMDPQWMLDLMKKFGPLDWRSPSAHALYWVTFGEHACRGTGLDNVDVLRCDRLVLICMKDMAWLGRLYYRDRANEPDSPIITSWCDLRFVEPLLREYQVIYDMETQQRRDVASMNAIRGGYINYVVSTIEMLYASDRPVLAQKILDDLRKKFDLKGQDWGEDVGSFVIGRLQEERDMPMEELAVSQYTMAIVSAMARLAHGDSKGARGFLNYARDRYDTWQKKAVKRIQRGPFDPEAAKIIALFLVRPEIFGYHISLEQRSAVYAQTEGDMRKWVYAILYQATSLRSQCQHAKPKPVNFDLAFPVPAGWEEFRAKNLQNPSDSGSEE